MTPTQKRNRTIIKGAIIIAAFSIISKVAGLLRVMLLSSRYATGDIADAYLASFRIPDLIFNTLVLGALSSAFIPVFLEYFHAKPNDGKTEKEKPETDTLEVGLEGSETSMSSPNVGFAQGIAELWSTSQKKWYEFCHKEHTEKWQLANTILNVIVLILLFFSIVFFILTPQMVALLAPGFSSGKQELVIAMTRVMLFSTVLFGISNVLGGMLQSFQRFLWFSLAPILYNLGIIAGILILAPRYGPIGLAYGVVLGAFLHLIVQVPAVLKEGFCWRPVFKLKHTGVRKILVLMLPRTLGLAALQINQLVNTFLASGLAVGSVAVFYYADSLQSLPVSIFGVSFALSAFPILSKTFNDKDDDSFVEIFSDNFRKILFIMIPVSLFMILLRAQIVRLVLGTGEFNWDATVSTLEVFGVFAVSLFAQGTIPLLARAFYARHDTKTPVISSVLSVAVNIALAFYFVPRYGLIGLALAFSAASLFNMTVLWTILRSRVSKLHTVASLISIIKISIISLVSGFAVYGMLQVMENLFNNRTYFGLLGQTAMSVIPGIILYIILAFAFGIPEVKRLFRRVKVKKQDL